MVGLLMRKISITDHRTWMLASIGHRLRFESDNAQRDVIACLEWKRTLSWFAFGSIFFMLLFLRVFEVDDWMIREFVGLFITSPTSGDLLLTSICFCFRVAVSLTILYIFCIPFNASFLMLNWLFNLYHL